MKYRIVKYNTVPQHLQNDHTPLYSIEYKRFPWSRWKPCDTDVDLNGKTVPLLMSRIQVRDMITEPLRHKIKIIEKNVTRQTIIKMETNTPIATTVSQSRRLLRLGLNPKTADMRSHVKAGDTRPARRPGHVATSALLTVVPLWSLSRLLSLLPGELRIRDIEVSPHIDLNDDVIYYSNDIDHVRIKAVYGDNLIEAAVNMLEWLIANNHLNARYLAPHPMPIGGRPAR